MSKVLAAAVVSFQIAMCSQAIGCNLPAPLTDIVLTVDGKIQECNQGRDVHLDQAMVRALTVTQVRTANPWDHGPSTYEGVLLRDLMKHVKANCFVATFSALNDYRADILLSDMDKYDVILAYKRDGVDLPVRDKGPFFVVFPFSDVPELASESRYAQSVWQVNRISVK